MRYASNTPSILRTAASTCARCAGSAISKTKREIATRSVVVETEPERMLRWWSESTRVTSESSRERSSASTWICTSNSVALPCVHSTSTSRSGCVRRSSTLTQSERCTLTPCDFVTKPTMSSPGTGVQHFASLTHTSPMPLTMTPGSPVRTRRESRPGRVGELLPGPRLPAKRGDETRNDGRRGDLPLADRGVQGRDVRIAQLGRDSQERLVRGHALDRQVLLAHRLRDRVLAVLDRLLAAFLREPLTDLVARPGALDEAQPVAARAGGLGLRGEHLDDVTVLEGRVERRQAAVDACTHRAVPDLGVHRVRKVDGGRARGQGDDVALGREDVDLRARELKAQRVEELPWVGRLALPVDELTQPRHLAGVLRGDRGPRILLVLPVRRDAVLCAPVHLVR